MSMDNLDWSQTPQRIASLAGARQAPAHLVGGSFNVDKLEECELCDQELNS